ncbi:MAG: hypothetical protein KDA89_19155, partial [Planctomycetaceae bacterium]|nr:hypothetical protein [Planctomycetaceae bacterium]
EEMVDKTATKFFEPPQLKVFDSLPNDECNTSIDEDFVPQVAATSADQILQNQADWSNSAVSRIRRHCFAAWPEETGQKAPRISGTAPVTTNIGSTDKPEHVHGLRLQFVSEPFVPLSADIYFSKTADDKDGNGSNGDAQLKTVKQFTLLVMDDQQWSRYAALSTDSGSGSSDAERSSAAPAASSEFQQQLKDLQSGIDAALVVFCPRGIGPHRWVGDERKQIQIRRRFQLIGATADGMRVFDILRAVRTLHTACPNTQNISLSASGTSDWLTLAAAVFAPKVNSVTVRDLPTERDQLPEWLNFDRIFTFPELLALAMHRCTVTAESDDNSIMEPANVLAADRRWTGRTVVEAGER